MATILIIDDDRGMNGMLVDLISSIGHDTRSATTLSQGIALLDQAPCDVVFLDVMMPDGSGLDRIQEIRKKPSAPEVIIMTGVGNADGAEMAIKCGAWDYLPKPLSPKEIILALKRVLQYHESEKRQSAAQIPCDTKGIVGSGPLLTACLSRLSQAARTDASVLITGETGTGKELFVRCLHANSSKPKESCVVVDCASLTETLAESTLFGHVKGAFTGASADREGLVKLADGGTLFLDEIGELNPSIQKVFLRVLQEKRFRPVGGRTELTSRFRLVSATHRNLDEMVEKGLFRKDLLYRLRAITIELPPLRQRLDDLPELAAHFAGKACKRFRLPAKGFAPGFMETLTAYPWPGNVRELAATMEGIISSAVDAPMLFPMHIPETIRVHVARQKINPVGAPDLPTPPSLKPAPSPSQAPLPYKQFRCRVLDEAEPAYLLKLLKYAHGNIKEACTLSKLSRARLYELMKKHQISKEQISSTEM
ncbi:MAG: sigma-54 dependent transcriptional regulator [Desulfobacterales bacterium]|nr:sigma-54 dependent transcriptional regulator [Desulfobacterales bacterium]